MEFFAGAIHPVTNQRYVCAGSAEPSVSNLVYLAQAVEPKICDWGEDASDEAVRFLANLILRRLNLHRNTILSNKLVQFLKSKKFESGKMWFLPKDMLDQWIKENVSVN